MIVVAVDDVVAVMRWLLDQSSVNGIFNVGTGKAESFRDMITAMFKALGRAPNIEYVDMPEEIRGQYQYFTQSSVENLRSPQGLKHFLRRATSSTLFRAHYGVGSR